MARNGSGTYSLPAGNPVVTGTTISSATTNTTLSDIATALTQSIAADGQTPVTANIPMNSKKITGLAAGTASGDALSFGQSGMGAIDATTVTASGAVVGNSTAQFGTTKTINVTTDGRLYGTQLHNNAGSMTGTTNQYVGSGTYVPTPVAGTNATAPTISTAWKWTRVGNVVSVSGTLLTGVLSAAGDTLTIIYIPLPIASAFTVVSNLNGTAGTTVADKWHFVQADATNDRAELNFAASTTSGHAYYLTFSYEVV